MSQVKIIFLTSKGILKIPIISMLNENIPEPIKKDKANLSSGFILLSFANTDINM
jgi:hypothetical protein